MFAWLFHGKCVFLQKDFMAILCFLWHICAWGIRLCWEGVEISDKRIIFALSFWEREHFEREYFERERYE